MHLPREEVVNGAIYRTQGERGGNKSNGNCSGQLVTKHVLYNGKCRDQTEYVYIYDASLHEWILILVHN